MSKTTDQEQELDRNIPGAGQSRAIPAATDQGQARAPITDDMELVTRFSYHPPRGGQQGIYERIRSDALDLASLIDVLCPNSREKSLAITKLEECVMWANASVARRG